MVLDVFHTRHDRGTTSRISRAFPAGPGAQRPLYRALSIKLLFAEHTPAGRGCGFVFPGNPVPRIACRGAVAAARMADRIAGGATPGAFRRPALRGVGLLPCVCA